MEEVSVGKITRKFIFKVLIWFLVIDLIAGFIAIMVFGSKADSISNDVVDMVTAVNGFIKGLIAINVIACVVSTLLATRKIKKKFVINGENKKQVFRNIAIVLTVMAVLLIGVHAGIKGTIFEKGLESSNLTEKEIKEGLDEGEEFLEDLDIDTDDIKLLKQFLTLSDIYVLDGLVFVVLIGCEYFLIIKKTED